MTGPSGEEVAAILLRALPKEVSEMLLSRLGEQRASKLRARLQAMEGSPPGADQVQNALRQISDIQRISVRPTPTPSSNPPTEVPSKPEEPPPTPKKKARKKFLQPNVPIGSDAIEALREIDATLLIRVLQGEQISTIALVMSTVDPDVASEIMKQLPQESRTEVVLKLTAPKLKSPQLIEEIAKAVVEKVRKFVEKAPEPTNDERISSLAGMLRGLSRIDRMPILEVLDKSDPETSQKVKEQLYSFEDIIRVDDRGLQGVLVELDMKTLATALTDAQPEISSKIFANMSSRTREMLNDEISMLGTINAAKVTEARSKVVAILRRFEDEGKIVIEL
jgi:flagellar motor switch protein FliG